MFSLSNMNGKLICKKGIMKTCQDCGCTLNKGICSNCQEELYIVEFQSDCIDKPLSNEFVKKVNEQIKYLSDK